ncbi:MAG: DUF1289 domain-containing protein [Methylosarcina sp.]
MNTNQSVTPSPCIRNCCLDKADVCLGCFRSLAEIISWGQADEMIRRTILKNVDQRREVYRQKYNSYRNSIL